MRILVRENWFLYEYVFFSGYKLIMVCNFNYNERSSEFNVILMIISFLAAPNK